MTQEMLAKSRSSARAMGLTNVEFRDGILEQLPIDAGEADVVMSNGVINLCADKRQVFGEIWRVLKPGGHLQFADIANGKPVPQSAMAKVDLWTGVNCRWSAVCSLARDDASERLRRRTDRPAS